MGTTKLQWVPNGDVSVTGQTIAKKLKSVPGSITDTSGFTPASLTTSSSSAVASVIDNRIYEFQVSSLVGSNPCEGPITEGIAFACNTPMIEAFSDTAVQVEAPSLNPDISKVRFTLRNHLGATVGTIEKPTLGASFLQHVFTGLVNGITYTVQIDYGSIINGNEVFSNLLNAGANSSVMAPCQSSYILPYTCSNNPATLYGNFESITVYQDLTNTQVQEAQIQLFNVTTGLLHGTAIIAPYSAGILLQTFTGLLAGNQYNLRMKHFTTTGNTVSSWLSHAGYCTTSNTTVFANPTATYSADPDNCRTRAEVTFTNLNSDFTYDVEINSLNGVDHYCFDCDTAYSALNPRSPGYTNTFLGTGEILRIKVGHGSIFGESTYTLTIREKRLGVYTGADFTQTIGVFDNAPTC